MSKSIFITGATSGIGKAVALELAKNGFNLALTGRKIDELKKIKEDLNSRYPKQKIEIKQLDVTDYESVPIILDECIHALDGIDIVFANAGINLPERLGSGKFENSKKIIETNLIGAMATIDSAAAYFLKKGSGHIVGMGSIAAFRGLPGVPSYCASKAGIVTYLEAVQAAMHDKNIDVTILNPGYIDTNINNKEKRRPFVISAEKGAKIIAKLIRKRVKSSTVPVFPWNVISILIKFLPASIIAKISKSR
jgi:short-subunit dehydrogenase